MKLPPDTPFVIFDRNMYGTQQGIRLTEGFIEWLVRDCAKVCADEMLCPEDEKYDNEVSVSVGEGTYANTMMERCRKAILKRYDLKD